MERLTIKKINIVNFAILLSFIVFLSFVSPLRSLENSQLIQNNREDIDEPLTTSTNVESQGIDINKWTLLVDGFVKNPLNLTYDELKALPAVTIFAELICYPNAPVTEGLWTGVQLSYLLNLAGAKPEAIDMVFIAVDDFSSSLPVSEIQNRPDILLAYEKDGEPLTQRDGFPVIIVAPGQGGYKWVKYVTHIELVDYDHKGYWESVGYPDDAVLTEYNFTVPVPIISTKQGEQDVITSLPEFDILNSVILIVTGLFLLGYIKRTFRS